MRHSWRLLAAIAAFLFPALSTDADTRPWEERTAAIGAAGAMPSGPIGKEEMERLREIGEDLFTAKFTINDGAGRPNATQAAIPTKVRHTNPNAFARTGGPDANSCFACHSLRP